MNTVPGARVGATSTAVCTALALALAAAPSAQPTVSLRVWRIDSPHRSDTASTTLPSALSRESDRIGYRFTVQAFPAQNFAATFRDAVARNDAPDVLVFDNMGVMTGLTTTRGRFEGLGEEPAFRNQFVQVTGSFDELLGPTRGWTYLFTRSSNHNPARMLALRAPECDSPASGRGPRTELAEAVTKLATAYVSGDDATVLAHSDPDRIPSRTSSREPVTVGALRRCGVWGSGRLSFVSVKTVYESRAAIGHHQTLLVLRNSSGRWQLLTAAADPVSNGRFVQVLASSRAFLPTSDAIGVAPGPALLLSPDPGEYPAPPPGQRFGTFWWRSSAGADVVAEVAEFAYKNDARLFLRAPSAPGALRGVSSGELWTTNSEWSWRVWSISRAGDVGFSETRMFTH